MSDAKIPVPHFILVLFSVVSVDSEEHTSSTHVSGEPPINDSENSLELEEEDDSNNDTEMPKTKFVNHFKLSEEDERRMAELETKIEVV